MIRSGVLCYLDSSLLGTPGEYDAVYDLLISVLHLGTRSFSTIFFSFVYMLVAVCTMRDDSL